MKKRDLIIISFVSLLALLPFVNRALFVDDHAHFKEAHDIIENPKIPYAGTDSSLGWNAGESPSEANPPVYFYLVGSLSKLVGSQEWKFHLVFIPIHLAGLIGFYFLSLKFTRHALWATLLWLFSPHFWITANALLVDTLLGPFMILGVCLWIYGWSKENKWLLLTGALFLGLSPLTKYTGFLSWGIIAFWTFLNFKKRKQNHIAFFLIPIAMVLTWFAWTHNIYGESHFSAVANESMVWPSLINWVNVLRFVSGTTPILVIPFCLFLIKKRSALHWIDYVIFFLGFGLSFALESDFYLSIQTGLWLAFSLVWLSMLRIRSHHQKENLFLWGWLGMGLIGLVFARGWVCARYYVILGPVFILLMVRMFENGIPELLEKKSFKNFSLLFYALFGLLLTFTDYTQANLYRVAAQEFNKQAQANFGDQKLYYPSASLTGLSYYLDKNHWAPIGPHEVLEENALLLVPAHTSPPVILPQIRHPQIVWQYTVQTWLPFRVLDRLSSAGFYGTIWGPLPFSLTTSPLERFNLVKNNAGGQNEKDLIE